MISERGHRDKLGNREQGRYHGTPGLLPPLPDQSAPIRPRAVVTMSAARPANIPCSVGLLGGVKESRADVPTVGDCGFCASTEAEAGVGGAGTAGDTRRKADGEIVFEAEWGCLTSAGSSETFGIAGAGSGDGDGDDDGGSGEGIEGDEGDASVFGLGETSTMAASRLLPS